MARKKDKPGTDNTQAMSTRCSWSAADDAILVRVLREQKDAGNQSGSGWKKTVWNLVAETLEKEGIPNGPPKSATKCSDHYSNLKANFLVVKEIRGASGFGWDEGTMTCVATDEVWDVYIQAHRKAAHWRNTPFPLYDEMSYLVDGVVATGAGAFHAGETPQSSPTPQAYQETEPDDSTQESAPGPSSIPSTSVGSLLDDDVAKEIETPAPSQTASKKRIRADSESPPHSSKKPRRRRDNPEQSLVATAIRDMALAMNGGPSTPQRRNKAIQLFIDDGEFSEEEEGDILYLFSTQINFADTYAGIPDPAKCKRYLRAVLSRHEV